MSRNITVSDLKKDHTWGFLIDRVTDYKRVTDGGV
jgi:hypothetical protein